MPKEEIALTVMQWQLCNGAVGRYAVPQNEAAHYRQDRLYAWLQFTKDEEAQICEGGPDTLITRHMAGGMKRRLVAIMTDFRFQNWAQAPYTKDVKPLLAILGWTLEYNESNGDDK